MGLAYHEHRVYVDIAKGNTELQKSIDAYGDDDNDKAAKHYDRAVAHFDDALDLIV